MLEFQYNLQYNPIKMQAVEATSLAPTAPKLPGKSIIWVLLLILISGIFAVFYFGSVGVHQANHHLLYDCFDLSPDHDKLTKQLKKNKFNIIYGKKEQGLFQFVENFGNQLVLQGRTVFTINFGEEDGLFNQVAKSARAQLQELLGWEQGEGDWIITSENGELIPDSFISSISTENPNSKILIATTSRRQINAKFKVLEYPEMQEHEIEESVERNFKVSQNTADILYDYFETAENIFRKMNFQQFSQENFLGDNYRSLDALDKEDNRILKDLCKKGEGDSEKERPKLTELGVVFHQGENYWLNAEARLNYELHKNLNCKNKLVSDQIMQAVEEEKALEAEKAQRQQADNDNQKKPKKGQNKKKSKEL